MVKLQIYSEQLYLIVFWPIIHNNWNNIPTYYLLTTYKPVSPQYIRATENQVESKGSQSVSSKSALNM